MEFLPKFREIDFFIIAVSVLTTAILYLDSMVEFGAQVTLEGLRSGGNVSGCIFFFAIFAFFVVTGYYLSLKSALTKGTPGREAVWVMVFSALVTLIPASLIGVFYLLIEVLRTGSFLEAIFMLVPLLILARSFALIVLFPKLNYRKLFREDVDAKRSEALLATAIIVGIGLVARFFTAYSFLIVFLFMQEGAELLVNVVSPLEQEKSRERAHRAGYLNQK